MAQGFCPNLLFHINEVAGENAPGRKMGVAGFLAMLFCCQNSSASILNTTYEGGHQRGATIKYRRRPLLSDTQTADNCDINTQPGYLEWNLPALNHRQISFHIADNLIRQYCLDASRMRTVGAPPTAVMQEIWDLIIEHASTLLRAINLDLVTAMATEFGVNVTTGTDTKAINIPRNGNDYILDNGIIDMMQDISENEICGEPCLVGGGIYSAYDRARALACCNAAGIDLSRGTGVPRFFFDKDTQTIWGENSVGLFAPGSVKFISRNRYVGPAWAGQKGNSTFATLPLPVNEFGCAEDCLRDLVFDMQFKYFDCPTEVEGGGTVDRGWQVILSKDFAFWVQPTDAFQPGDELEGTNGTLKYFVGNSTYNGPAYGAYA